MQQPPGWQPQGQWQQPQRDYHARQMRLGWLLFGGVTVGSLVIGGIVWLASGDGGGTRYRITGGCPVVSIAYDVPGAGSQTFRVAPPWTSPSIRYPSGVQAMAIVTGEGCANRVTCEVLVRGNVVATRSGDGAVLCNAVIY